MSRPCILLLIGPAAALLWGQAESLTLSQAEQIALQNHPRIGAARFTAQAASQAVAETQSSYYPLAYGNVSGAGALPSTQIAAGTLANSSVYNRYAEGLAVSQLITDFGRTANLVQSARMRAGAAGQDVEAARDEILLRVNRAYFGTLRQQAIFKVARETVEERQLVANQVATLAKSKLKSDVDLTFANVNLAEAKLLLVQAENDLQASFASLSEALGYQAHHTFELSETALPDPPPLDVSPLIEQALRKRPEVLRQQYSEEASRSIARAERDLWFPSIGSLAVAGLTPLHPKALHDRYAAVGLNITLPLFNGHLFSARRAEAESRLSAEQQSLRAVENQVVRDVRIAWLSAGTAYQRIALTQQLLEQANLALELAQARYRLGLGSIVELSQAQLARTQAQIQHAAARYDYQIAFATLRYQAAL